MTPEPAEANPDRRTDVTEKPRRFRIRIRDWLVAVVLVALVAAGAAQVIRARRLRVERELAEAIRLQERAIRLQEALKSARERAAVREAAERTKKSRDERIETPRAVRDGVSPDPDDGRIVL